jgi:hypothetical protein
MAAIRFRRKAHAIFLILGAALVLLPSCSGDYCLRCIDLSAVRPDIEGCDNDLEGLQTASDFWEGEGFACVIFEN